MSRLESPPTNSWFESIGSIVSRQSTFSNYPAFQREKVWSMPMKRRLIDSVLQNWPIGQIVVAQEILALLGMSYKVLDGQQRISTIISFYRDEFKTQQQSWRNELGVTPEEPYRTFSEMSKDAQDRFLAYKIPILQIDRASWEELGCMFRRLQWANPLTSGEKLWSYQNPNALKWNEVLSNHPFFSSVYSGRRTRKEVFQMICTLIILSSRGPYANISTGNLHDAAHGVITVSDDGLNRMKKNLDIIVKLFEGYQTSARVEIVPLVQAIHMLETENCDFPSSEPGSLSVWWSKLQESSRLMENGYPTRQLQGWDKTGTQARFWIAYCDELFDLPGLKFRDKRRKFSETMKLKAWQRQNGRCAFCGKMLFLGQAVGHHKIDWSIGGMTEEENCEAVHELCHRKGRNHLEEHQLTF